MTRSEQLYTYIGILFCLPTAAFVLFLAASDFALGDIDLAPGEPHVTWIVLLWCGICLSIALVTFFRNQWTRRLSRTNTQIQALALYLSGFGILLAIVGLVLLHRQPPPTPDQSNYHRPREDEDA